MKNEKSLITNGSGWRGKLLRYEAHTQAGTPASSIVVCHCEAEGA